MYQEAIFSPVNTHFKKFVQKPGLGCTSPVTVQMKRFNALFRSILSEFRSITVRWYQFHTMIHYQLSFRFEALVAPFSERISEKEYTSETLTCNSVQFY